MTDQDNNNENRIPNLCVQIQLCTTINILLLLSTASASCVQFPLLGSTKKTQEGTRARLATDVFGLVLVGETVEASSRALGVSAHVLEVKPVADINGVASKPLLGNAVDAVASRAPDRVLDRLGAACGSIDLLGRSVALVGERFGAVVEAVGTAARGEHLRDGVLVVEHDAAEVAVDAIIEVEHVALHIESWVLDSATCNDVAGDREG